ncbi:unnamed protein product [Soboliphyme baturini]|uniref:SAM domain-containing protein n=1 Tax=Soboliphyme baturini TaxID=241478 RepID=A0A183IHA3_9BILA|nr:unnamed protein product [Soboliphyme baturini]
MSSGDMGITKSAKEWSYQEVRTWLEENGFAQYAELIAGRHKVDGKVLLCLSEEDLRCPPLSINILGDIKRLSQAIDCLKTDDDANSGCYCDCRHICSGQWSRNIVTALPPSASSSADRSDSVFYNTEELKQNVIIRRVETDDIRSHCSCVLKTLVAAFYFSCSILLTSLVMVIVHDRVPDAKTYPPLPDMLLDNIPHIPWAFYSCEILGCFLAAILFVIFFFHKHRRFFSLAGTVFLLRCITMMITSLSVPGVHLKCAARKNSNWYEKLDDAFHIWYGMGMSMFGVRSCGDYMFSGHTSVVTLLNHFITEYTPDTWNYLHTISWVGNLFAIFFILAGHEHYSIDVFIAFYISSRLFLYYHSMAYNARFVTAADDRLKIWFPLFWFLESGSPSGRIPNEFEWPLPSLSSICDLLNGSYFIEKSKTEFSLLQSRYHIQVDKVHRFLFHSNNTDFSKKKRSHKAKAQ